MAEPGWYPDPENPAAVRWFDGIQWTEHRQAAPEQQTYQQPAPQQPTFEQQAYESYQQPSYQHQGHGAPPPTYLPPSQGPAPATAANPVALLLAGLGAGLAFFVLGTIAGESLPVWDGFDEQAIAAGAALQGALLGLAIGLVSPGERAQVIGLSVVLGALAGAVLGYFQLDLFEALEPDGPGLTAILPIVLLGAAIGAGVGLGARGPSGLVGGMLGGAAGYFAAAALSGALSEDIDTLRLPLIGFEFAQDEVKNLGGTLLAMGPIGLGIALLQGSKR